MYTTLFSVMKIDRSTLYTLFNENVKLVQQLKKLTDKFIKIKRTIASKIKFSRAP